MRKIIVMSDSTCDLSKEILSKRNIHTIPLKVCFNEEVYLDSVNITAVELYKKVKELNMLPKTAAATITEFSEYITKLVNEGNDIIYCGIGSKLSSTYQNLLISLKEVGEDIASHVFPVDSLNLSTGTGLIVLKICDMVDQGLDAKTIQEKANKIVSCVRAQFSVRDLEFLHKGGRCSGTTKFFGTMLRIRPILRVFNGNIILSEKIFGRFEKSLDFQIQDLINNIDNIDKEYLFITHSEGDEYAQYVLDNIPENIKSQFKNIYVTKAGCVISAHCGEKTLGILYIKNSPLTSDK